MGIRKRIHKILPILRLVFPLQGILGYSVSPSGAEMLTQGTENLEIPVALLCIALSHRTATNPTA